jgi:hypothetical protein
MHLELNGNLDINYPVKSPAIASRHTVALSFFANSANVSKNPSSDEFSMYYAPISSRISTYSGLLTMLINGIFSAKHSLLIILPNYEQAAV